MPIQMQQTASIIYNNKSISLVEKEIVSVKEIFRLQNADELKKAEEINARNAM